MNEYDKCNERVLLTPGDNLALLSKYSRTQTNDDKEKNWILREQTDGEESSVKMRLLTDRIRWSIKRRMEASVWSSALLICFDVRFKLRCTVWTSFSSQNGIFTCRLPEHHASKKRERFAALYKHRRTEENELQIMESQIKQIEISSSGGDYKSGFKSTTVIGKQGATH